MEHELLLGLDRTGPGPLRAKLESALRDAVRGGRLKHGARLPSTRVLATDLGLSRRLVVEVYSQLVAEGYLVARPGAATRVAATRVAQHPPAARTDQTTGLRWDFRPAHPDLSLFPRTIWSRALSRTLSEIPSRALGYPDPRGTMVLRAELAAYLRRVRGVHAEPERLVICNGFAQALALICRVLAPRRTLAVEDPGSPLAWPRIRAAGMTRVPVPVDERGISVASLAASDAAVALVTPAHQYPTGVALAPERRTALLDWASAGGLVIEDDYDAEFRYDRQPVGALQGLAPERVVYAGSVSKTLAPALRLGWLQLPAEIVDDFIDAKRADDLGSAVLDQHAFANLLATGAYDRHLRRARRRYQAKRDALLAALGREAPDLRVRGIAAGLQAVVTLPDDVDEREVCRAAAERSIGVYPLHRYRIETAPVPPELVLGFGGLSESTITTGIAQLSDVISRAAKHDDQPR